MSWRSLRPALSSRRFVVVGESQALPLTDRGHYNLIGTATQIADQLQVWFEQRAADGFNVQGRSCSVVACSACSTAARPCGKTWACNGLIIALQEMHE